MTKPVETDEEREAYDAIYKTWFFDVPPGMKVGRVSKARRKMYDGVHALSRRQSAVYFTIWDELERQGVGSDEPSWGARGDVVRKAVDAKLEAWSESQLEADAPVPQTPFEELLDQHHRLKWEEWNLLDDIEKREGAVSPMHDSRPYSTPRPCPYPMPLLVVDNEARRADTD